MLPKSPSFFLSVALLAPLCTTACGGDEDDTVASDQRISDAVKSYAKIVEASYADSITAAKDLQTANAAFVMAPSTVTHSAAKQAWLDSREPYLQTEVYRFYDGPIDDGDGPEGLLNAWPLGERYIDYVEGDETSGIINDDTVTIDAATLVGLNEGGSDDPDVAATNIATGYHAVEFLLWGQDLNDAIEGDTAGQRPHTDYIDGPEGTAANAVRRGEYLNVVSGLIVSDLEGVAAEWAPTGAYRTEFEAAGKDALRRILVGMIVLSGFETGGERLLAALVNNDQEDEHSCFSDNTHRDMIQDVQGISNVWNGTYTRLDDSVISGVSIADVVAAEDEGLAARITAKISATLTLGNALQVPFDNEIKAGNIEGVARVTALATSLQELEKLLEEVFKLYEFEIPNPE